MEKPEFLIYFLTLMRLVTSGQKSRLHDVFIMMSRSLRLDSGLGSAVGGFVPKVQAPEAGALRLVGASGQAALAL